MRDKLYIFMDVDGCLIDRYHNFNVPRRYLEDFLKKMERFDVIFGVNSNRAYKDIKNFQNLIYTKGPCIGESGAFYIFDGCRKEFTNKISFKNNLWNNLSLKLSLNLEGCIIKKHKKIRDDLKLPTGAYFFYDKEREYTLSFYCYTSNNDKLIKDSILAERVVEEIKNDFPNFVFHYNRNHVIGLPKDCNKGKALKQLIKDYSLKSTVMIGHDESDIPAFEATTFSAAPKNIVSSIANKVDYVSHKNFTAGAIDAINFIIQNYWIRKK